MSKLAVNALDHLARRVISVADRLNAKPEMDQDELAAVSGDGERVAQND